MSEPREFIAVLDETGEINYFVHQTQFIEKSAYAAMVAENEQLKTAVAEQAGVENSLRAANAELVEALEDCIAKMAEECPATTMVQAEKVLAKHGGDK